MLNVYYDIVTKKLFTSSTLDAQVLVVGVSVVLGRTVFRVVGAHEIDKTYSRLGVGVQPFSQLVSVKPIGEYARSAFVGSVRWF